MTGNQYVAGVLARYTVNETAAKNAANSIVPVINAWAGNNISAIQYSGSTAKGTGNNISTDLDLFISLRSDTPATLEVIYSSLYKQLLQRGCNPRRQNVAIGITHSGFKVDLVPGKIQSGYQNRHSLYKNKTNSWTQTDVNMHINKVRNSGRIDEIRAIKLWRNLHDLSFPSFFLELAVIEALHNRTKGNLANNVLYALSHIGQNIEVIRIIDPANTNNVISDDLSQSEKRLLSYQARSSAAEQYWRDIIW